jgi:flavin-dependent dehydrogenase
MKRIVIVGGGTAGWITAAYLARTLGAKSPDGISITLVESADIGILGVGEGTFPTIRKTLRRIGIDETALVRDCDATFKQGAKFVNWRFIPEDLRHNHYLHAFQVTQDFGGLDLLPYWLLGVAGEAVNWDEVNTPQKPVADAHRAPKLITHESFTAPLNYAYHVDAVKLARFLRATAIELGVTHVVDTVETVSLAENGSIGSLKLQGHGVLAGDLYVDCTGFRAELIGKALGIPYKSCQSTLFCDTALAVQVPYAEPSTPIPSYTISTAQVAGWTWDIGLQKRRGVGYVYSSAHTSQEMAEATLRNYLGPHAATAESREIRFNAGYRETNWHKNCVAIGLSSGFFEPLEATGIIFVEVAAAMLANLFPWGGELETAARQYNIIMLKRYERARDFIKMHYSLTERRDSEFWRDNADSATSPDSLLELIDRWRFRPPGAIDIDLNTDLFTEHSWQYVLYGMGFRTDLRPKRGVFRYFNEARQAFLEVGRQTRHALETLPTNRELIHQARIRRFGSPA